MKKTILLFSFLFIINLYPADWPMWQKDAKNSGWTDEELIEPFSRRWCFVPPDQELFHYIIQPIVADGKCFAATYTGTMYALNETNGNIIWSFQADATIIQTAAYSTNGKIFFGSIDKKMYALDADTGSNSWTFTTGGGIVSSPLIAENRLFFGSRDKYFYCLDINDGSLIWKKKLGGPVAASAAYYEGYIYIVPEDLYFYSLNSTNGEIQWKKQIYGSTAYMSWVVATTNLVIINTTMAEVGEHQENALVNNILTNANENWTNAQSNIRAYLQANPWRRTLFALDRDTGIESGNIPAFTWMEKHSQCAPQVWLDDNETIYLTFRSPNPMALYSTSTYGSTIPMDYGYMDPATKNFISFGPPNSTRITFGGYSLDDAGIYTMGGQIIYQGHNLRGIGAMDISNVSAIDTFGCMTVEAGQEWITTSTLVIKDPQTVRGRINFNRGSGMAGVSIANNALYFVIGDGQLVCVEGTPR